MILATFNYEKTFWNQGLEYVVGLDEVGRGCFAGPLVAAAVIFPKNSKKTYDITDSKLLTAKKRQELSEIIKDKAFSYSIISIDVPFINSHGIGQAIQYAFNELLETLPIEPHHILVDGFAIKNIDKEKQTPIIKGDQKSVSIAAASIIAKVYRDKMMMKISEQFPPYFFAENKGYGTKIHREAIQKFGLSPMHRTSFDLQKYIVEL